MAYNNDDERFGSELNRGAKNAARQAGRSVKRAVKNRTRMIRQKMRRKVIQATVKASAKFLAIFGKYAIIIIPIVLLILLAGYIVDVETVGTSGFLVEDSELQNPSIRNESGNIEAVALLEPHALKDAYYKYMACKSYQKLYGNSGDEGLLLEFDYEDEEELQDFAGLADYYEKEDNFYLSADFILYADQFLHKDEFYFPEQIIKPVWWTWTDDGKIEAQNLKDGENKKYPVDEQAETIPFESNEDSMLNVESFSYVPDPSSPDDKYVKQSTTEKEKGVWDYGLGSVLQYEAHEVDWYLDYDIQTIDIESPIIEDGDIVDYEIITYDINGNYRDAEEKENEETGETYWVYTYPPATDKLPSGTDVTARLQMYLEGKDIEIGKREFNNPRLDDLFGNGGTEQYPIKVPLVVSAATMSGNMKYEYTPVSTTDSLDIGTSENKYDKVDTIAYDTASDGTVLTYYRTGTTTRTQPSPTSSDEDPWGFEYLDDYSESYIAYPSDIVKEDLSFSERLTDELRNFLRTLGLLVPYGSSSGTYTAWGPSGYTAEELDEMIDSYLNGYTGRSLAGCGEDLIEMENEYDVNAVFALAVAIQEQGMGKSQSSHINYNNFFSMIGSGTAGSWYSSTGRKWSSWLTPGDSIMGFAKNLVNHGGGSSYGGKTIYGIGQTYCPNAEVAGQAEGWGAGVMKHMEMLMGYLDSAPEESAVDEFLRMQSSQEIYESGQEPAGYDSGKVDESEWVLGTDPQYPLYKIRSFDVRTATSVLQKTAEKDQTLLEKAEAVLNAIGGAITDAISQALTSIFGTVAPPARYEFWQNNLTQDNVRLIVYHAIGSVNGLLTSDVKKQLDSMDENEIFLFVGKANINALNPFAYTSTVIPSTLCTVQGMASPTSQHYSVAESYNPSIGGTVYATPVGTSLKAVAEGTVKSVNNTASGTGKSITIEYKIDGVKYEITYGYLSDTMGLNVGDEVIQGQVVGQSGKNPSTDEPGYLLSIKEDGSLKNPEEYFYQPSTSGGPGFPNLLDASGRFNMDTVRQLEQRIIDLNWFYPSGSSTRLTTPRLGDWIEGGTPAGVQRMFDKWHDSAMGINKLEEWQCTWWFRGRASEWLEYYGTKYKSILVGATNILHGNGGEIYDYNLKEGYFESGSTPRPYSAIVWGRGSSNHVGFVEAVEQGSSMPRILVSEAGNGNLWRGLKVYDYPYVFSGTEPSGFVYLDSPK